MFDRLVGRLFDRRPGGCCPCVVRLGGAASRGPVPRRPAALPPAGARDTTGYVLRPPLQRPAAPSCVSPFCSPPALLQSTRPRPSLACTRSSPARMWPLVSAWGWWWWWWWCVCVWWWWWWGGGGGRQACWARLPLPRLLPALCRCACAACWAAAADTGTCPPHFCVPPPPLPSCRVPRPGAAVRSPGGRSPRQPAGSASGSPPGGGGLAHADYDARVCVPHRRLLAPRCLPAGAAPRDIASVPPAAAWCAAAASSSPPWRGWGARQRAASLVPVRPPPCTPVPAAAGCVKHSRRAKAAEEQDGGRERDCVARSWRYGEGRGQQTKTEGESSTGWAAKSCVRAVGWTAKSTTA